MNANDRKLVYERILTDFEADWQYRKETGFCRSLIMQRAQHEGDISVSLEDYPELMKQRPRGADEKHYWWDIAPNSNGRDRRIEVLKKAIKECNKQLKKA